VGTAHELNRSGATDSVHSDSMAIDDRLGDSISYEIRSLKNGDLS
jgi:hypothetical protein